MTKAELIARLRENKDTPFYKSNYNVEEVIELLNNMGEKDRRDFISIADNQDVAMSRAFNYIEEHIAEELPPFSISWVVLCSTRTVTNQPEARFSTY